MTMSTCQPVHGQCDFAQRLAELDLWREVQSEHGQCEFAQRLADQSFWQMVLSKIFDR